MIGAKDWGKWSIEAKASCQQRKPGAGLYFLEEVRLVVEKLHQVVTEY
jgi:hypothetical protein